MNQVNRRGKLEEIIGVNADDKQKKKLRAVAYHEAGHAVFAYQTKEKLKKVTIQPGEGYLGCVFTKPYYKLKYIEYSSSTKLWDRVDKIIEGLFAGYWAAKTFCSSRGSGGCSSDFQDIVDYAVRICGEGDELNAFLRWKKIRVKNCIQNNKVIRMMIQALAEELLKKRTLTGDEVVAFLDNVASSWHLTPLTKS
jgi:hypothetical protein